MKIIITENQLHEIIKSSDVYDDVDSVKSIADGRRNVAFIGLKHISIKSRVLISKIVGENNLKVLYVGGDDNYVVYRQGSESEANELKKIAEKYDGYLSYKATDDEERRIGQILSYDPEDTERHIRNKKERMKQQDLQ